MTQPRDEKADLKGAARDRLEAAGGVDDAARLRMLDELYERLETELEGDLDQEGPAGR